MAVRAITTTRSSSPAVVRLQNTLAPRLRRPAEVLDEELIPYLDVEMVFGDLRQLQPDGPYLQSCCPIHRGGEPGAFSVDPDRLEWICFLGCGGGGPIQFLQKSQSLSWIESAQALSVMAGVDPLKLQVWGEHWTEDDFRKHDSLEQRSSLLRVLVALLRSLLLSPAGKTLRGYLKTRHGIPESSISALELGLYSNSSDIFHFLKATGQDLSDLKSRGLFENDWTGRMVVPWRDLSGRTVNLWSWSTGSPLQSDRKSGRALFGRDPFGSQRIPFQLQPALARGKRNLLLLEDPFQAMLLLAHGLDDPFPISSCGSLTTEHVDILERILAADGTLTVLTDYHPDTYGTQADRAFRAVRILKEVSFPVMLVDSRLMATDRKQTALVEDYLGQKSISGMKALLKTCEVVIAPQTPPSAQVDALWPSLGRVFGTDRSSGERMTATVDPGQAHVSADGSLLTNFLHAAEEIGQRIARGFLRGLNQAENGAPGKTLLNAPSAPLQLPDSLPQDIPEEFSVDRMDESSRQSGAIKSSGWRSLDSIEVRFRPQELTVIGGPGGEGRTAALLGLLTNWLEQTEERFVFFSFQESEIQVYHRILSLLTALPGAGWSSAEIGSYLAGSNEARNKSGHDVERLEWAREKLRGWEGRLQIVYRPQWTIGQLEAYCRQTFENSPRGGLLIDALDRIVPSTRPEEAQFSVAVEGSRLKQLAVDLNCPVMVSVTTQSPGSGNASTPKGPALSDFNELLVREADQVLGIINWGLREEGRQATTGSCRFQIGVLKNRRGGSGKWANLLLYSRCCQLRDSGEMPQTR